MPYALTNESKVNKLHKPAANISRVIFPTKQSSVKAVNELSVGHQKHGRPLGSKDIIPQIRE